MGLKESAENQLIRSWKTIAFPKWPPCARSHGGGWQSRSALKQLRARCAGGGRRRQPRQAPPPRLLRCWLAAAARRATVSVVEGRQWRPGTGGGARSCRRSLRAALRSPASCPTSDRPRPAASIRLVQFIF